MTDAPDWAIRPAYTSQVHQELPRTDRLDRISQNKMDQLTTWSGNVAGKDELAAGTVPVAGSSVNGTVYANNVGIAPASAVSLKETNLLVSNNFSSPSSIVTQHNWSWNSDGNITPGCAMVRCDGNQDDLVSNEIPVITGESIEVSCQVRWEDLEYTGSNVIALGVEKYRKGRDKNTGGVTYLDLGGFNVDYVESPGSDSEWEEFPLAGVYVVEPGVDQIRFRFHVASTVTSGVVKWDEANFLKLDLIDDAAVPGVTSTIDSIVTNLYGSAGEGFTRNDAAVALANTASTLTSVNGRLAAIESEGYTGAVAGDDFLWSGEITANANWGGGYSASGYYGSYQANGADAVWYGEGFIFPPGNQQCTFIWEGTDAVSQSDYQLVQLLLSSAPMTDNGYAAYVSIYGRIASGWASYIVASFSSYGTYSVGYYNNGSTVTMASGNCGVPGNGSLISLYCGNRATSAPRHFTLKMGSSMICDFDESGTGSALGASNRGWGWGGLAMGGLYLALITFLPAQGYLPVVNQWLAYDVT